MRDVFEVSAWQQESHVLRTTPVDIVYFIQQGDDGPVKIGSTRNLHSRLRTLQVGNAAPLVCRAVLPGGGVVEGNLHARFSAARLLGEWFEPAPDLIAFVATEAHPAPTCDEEAAPFASWLEEHATDGFVPVGGRWVFGAYHSVSQQALARTYGIDGPRALALLEDVLSRLPEPAARAARLVPPREFVAIAAAVTGLDLEWLRIVCTTSELDWGRP